MPYCVAVNSLITAVLPSPGYNFLTATLKCICNYSFIDVLRVVSVLWLQDELGSCLLGCLMQLVSSKPLITTVSSACLQPW